MRPVLHSDLTAAARALLAAPRTERNALCAQLLFEADVADRYTKRFGRPHSVWGNGTLLASARRYELVSEPCFSDRSYLSCLSLILKQLEARRERQN